MWFRAPIPTFHLVTLCSNRVPLSNVAPITPPFPVILCSSNDPLSYVIPITFPFPSDVFTVPFSYVVPITLASPVTLSSSSFIGWGGSYHPPFPVFIQSFIELCGSLNTSSPLTLCSELRLVIWLLSPHPFLWCCVYPRFYSYVVPITPPFPVMCLSKVLLSYVVPFTPIFCDVVFIQGSINLCGSYHPPFLWHVHPRFYQVMWFLSPLPSPVTLWSNRVPLSYVVPISSFSLWCCVHSGAYRVMSTGPMLHCDAVLVPTRNCVDGSRWCVFWTYRWSKFIS